MHALASLCRNLLGLFLVISAFDLCAAPAASQRERLLLDFDWKFHLGDEWGTAQNLGKAATGKGPASMSFADAGWRTINLPHEWAVELPFDPAADDAHGFKAVGRGFATNNIGWYRRVFELPKADAGKRLWLEFDGVYRDCVVFVNGWSVGRQESGYSSFRYDITDIANCGGNNVVAVKVDASQPEGWFYEGAGIYRHVWFVKTAPVAIAPDGSFVSIKFKNNVPQGQGEIHILTHIDNAESRPVHALVRYAVIDPQGKPAGQSKRSSDLASRSGSDIQSVIPVIQSGRGLMLWSPESPKLYQLVTTVEVDGGVVDRTETEFGIRTVGFDAAKGFLLNGQPYVIKGTCNHQDHAGVGVALPDRLQYFRVARLKEMGCNAYRTSHNPPTPELLQACDRLGLLVMDENRHFGSDVQNLDQLERFIRRDRNHPSVAIWSIGNEEDAVQSIAVGGRVADTMQELVKRLDSTRPITYAANLANVFNGIDGVIEVRGWNYNPGGSMDAYHRAHPAQPNLGTEQGSTVCTRGIYTNDKQRGYVSAYDDNTPRWAQTAETWWKYFAPRPWLSGGFVWTGFDYRGEPTPYSWPCINSHFGIFDTCGFPKDNF
jgi:beta-galactosidase